MSWVLPLMGVWPYDKKVSASIHQPSNPTPPRPGAPPLAARRWPQPLALTGRNPLVRPVFACSCAHHDPQKEEAAIESLKKGLATLNSFLESRTYMVGDAVTLADIVLVCNEFHGMTKVFDAGFRKAFPHVERHFVTCVNHPVFKKVMGEVALCKEVMKGERLPVLACVRPLVTSKAGDGGMGAACAEGRGGCCRGVAVSAAASYAGPLLTFC